MFTVALNLDESIVKFDPFKNVFSTVTRRQRLIDSLHAGLGFLATHTSVWWICSFGCFARIIHVSLCFHFFLFFHPILLSSPFLSCSLLIVVAQIRGHIVGSSPPSPSQYVPRIFTARRIACSLYIAHGKRMQGQLLCCFFFYERST